MIRNRPQWLRQVLWKRAKLLVLLLDCGRIWGQTPEVREIPNTPRKDLTQVTIENLMNMEVSSVSKKEQKLSHVASAIFVITQEEIQRSGASNIPDLLRMVPGMEVSQINANTWAITARGFNGQFSKELLVMVDGRSVYTPTFGGVYWDVLDMPLENIERIEVIRGPGGSVWGANAVNGVINIMTKKAGAARGVKVVAGAGNLDHGMGMVQYGGQLGKRTDYRVYAKYLNQNHMPGLTGHDGGDGWHILRSGFRTDSKPSAQDNLMVEGEIYTGEEGNPASLLPTVTSPRPVNTEIDVHVSGGSLQTAWEHTYAGGSDSTLSISYDTYKRRNPLGEGRSTFDLDFQHHIAWGSRQDFVWGIGYRYSVSHSDGSLTISLNPADLDTQEFNSFIQDEIGLIPDRVRLTIGTKLEHNHYTGFAIMPSARVTYTPRADTAFWAAVSKALRTPAQTDAAIRLSIAGFSLPNGVPALVSVVGNPNFQNEGVVAYEAGFRASMRNRFSIDISAYYNRYDNQQTTEPATPFFESTPLPPHVVLPNMFQNLMHGESQGMEVAANWRITDRWTLSPGYAFERIHMQVSPQSQDTESVPRTEGSDPHVQAQLRSHFSVTPILGWDASVYFVDRLVFQGVPAYTRLDTGLSWRWTERLTVSVVGQDLLRDRHLEFDNNSGAMSTFIKRSAYAKLTWQF